MGHSLCTHNRISGKRTPEALVLEG
ncbi:protein of unknown function (plasmid) [Azospirillum baldaniorum]|uniref:Uncharacterized protein n=1 Tax=Azospirillum baldaniorum TaxID=1064539 RepID=A0A9P1NQW7_9PROT|nr:protein of unknown function [Azospirillum baldaniorum]